MKKDDLFDLIIIGAGAAGMIAAITAAKNNKKVLLLEKLSNIGAKLRATGGGRCNLTNTLKDEDFMAKFGRDGRFMQDAIKLFGSKELQNFFKTIGVETHAPDGFRVFPTSHNSSTILNALQKTMDNLGVITKTSQKVIEIFQIKKKINLLITNTDTYRCKNIIIASGGLGYPALGAEGDGYKLASKLGHTVSKLYPAMMPLKTKENWVQNCYQLLNKDNCTWE